MKSIFDLVSLCLFAGLAILFLQRSASSKPDPVPLWRYGVAGVACAGGDVLGNNGFEIGGWITLAATVIFALTMLKPFERQ